MKGLWSIVDLIRDWVYSDLKCVKIYDVLGFDILIILKWFKTHFSQRFLKEYEF